MKEGKVLLLVIKCKEHDQHTKQLSTNVSVSFIKFIWHLDKTLLYNIKKVFWCLNLKMSIAI